MMKTTPSTTGATPPAKVKSSDGTGERSQRTLNGIPMGKRDGKGEGCNVKGRGKKY